MAQTAVTERAARFSPRVTRTAVDAGCALALFLLAGVLTIWVGGEFRRSGIRPEFYQAEFVPAAMFACGQGFYRVDFRTERALKEFLLEQRESLACGEVRRGQVRLARNAFQNVSLYLELSVGLTWRLAGVSWSAVSWLNALLAGCFAGMVYGVMRLGMRPLFATIVAAVVVTSPLHLGYVPQLRDYSKAPFLLALILLMGIAVKRTLSLRQLLCLSVLGGFVAGVGLGFRTDLLLAAIPFLATLFIFRAGPPSIRSRLIEGGAASAVFVTTFLLTAAPVLKGYTKGGGNSAHVILLGFGSSFSPPLGVEAKHYELSALYNDGFQETVVRSYARRVNGVSDVVATGSKEYERESNLYLMQLIRTFPADVAVRALSAVAQIANMPFSTSAARATGWVHSPFVARLYDRRAAVLERVGWLGWAASVLVIAGVAALSVRRAAFLVFILAFLGGGAAIQFHPRHFFYLEFAAWWAVGVLVDRAVAAGRVIPEIVRHRSWLTLENLARAGVGLARSAGLIGAALLMTTVVLGANRHRQQENMNRLFDRVLAAAGPPLEVARVPNGVQRVTLVPDLPDLELKDPGSWRSHSIETAYLLIDLNPQRCDASTFAAIVRYDAGSADSDFTTSVNVTIVDPHLGSTVKILTPVYAAWSSNGNRQKTAFHGIDVGRRDADCVASIRRVGGLESFPVLLTAILGPDWREAPHYQTMIGIEARDEGVAWRERMYTTLPSLEVSRSVASGPTTDIWSGALVVSRAAVRMPPAGVAVGGRPEAPYTYLVQARERAIPRGTCAIAEGELTAGGLTFGILRNNRWYQQVNIVDRGRFLAAGCAEEDGNYSLVLANDNPDGGVTAARLTRIGWVLDRATPVPES